MSSTSVGSSSSVESTHFDSEDEHWVSALTAGYTHWSRLYAGLEAGVGSSVTVDVLPAAWADVYGHRHPLTARLILQLRGSGRWER